MKLNYDKKLQKDFDNWKIKKHTEDKYNVEKSVHDLLWESDSDCKAVYLYLKEKYGIKEEQIDSFNSSQDEYANEIIQVMAVETDKIKISFIQFHNGGDYRGNYTDAFIVKNSFEDLLLSYDRANEDWT